MYEAANPCIRQVMRFRQARLLCRRLPMSGQSVQKPCISIGFSDLEPIAYKALRPSQPLRIRLKYVSNRIIFSHAVLPLTVDSRQWSVNA